jgi:GxxExxY protein
MNGDDGDRQRDDLTGRIINAIIAVHRTLGPGFLESIYRNSLMLELKKQNLEVEHEKEIAIHYDGAEVGRHRLDLLVDGCIVLELKTVEELGRAHYAQLRSYLKASECTTGLLVNFSGDKADFRRIDL